jgi:hypothetical protein
MPMLQSDNRIGPCHYRSPCTAASGAAPALQSCPSRMPSTVWLHGCLQGLIMDMTGRSNAEMPLSPPWQIGGRTCRLARPQRALSFSASACSVPSCLVWAKGSSADAVQAHGNLCQEDTMAGLTAHLWVVQAQCALHLAHLSLDLLQPDTCAYALSLLLPAWHRGSGATSPCWHARQCKIARLSRLVRDSKGESPSYEPERGVHGQQVQGGRLTWAFCWHQHPP